MAKLRPNIIPHQPILSLVKAEGIDLNRFLPLEGEITAEVAEVIETEAIITDVTPKTLNGGNSIPVCGHIRNLGKNRHPSPEKIMDAKTFGIEPGENQTWVEGDLKNQKAA